MHAGATTATGTIAVPPFTRAVSAGWRLRMKTPRIRTILRVVRRGLASYFTASIRSMSWRSISLTSRVTSIPFDLARS